ncbi:MAG: hypothetical protein SVX43_02150 [Cyanobacteriota bacterium]|nr:hypothetical protein [Cyanobacteriota bacterium]
MTRSDIRTKVFEEIQQIPDNKLLELLNLIHAFRLRSQPTPSQSQRIMQFAGCWKEFPDETYGEFLDDIFLRRQQAFSQRQNRETRFG